MNNSHISPFFLNGRETFELLKGTHMFFSYSFCRYETFELKVIHRRRRTGFEDSKDFPIRKNDLIAGRYQVCLSGLKHWQDVFLRTHNPSCESFPLSGVVLQSPCLVRFLAAGLAAAVVSVLCL